MNERKGKEERSLHFLSHLSGVEIDKKEKGKKEEKKMKAKKLLLFMMMVLGLFVITGCGGGDDSVSIDGDVDINEPPVVDGGPDQTVEIYHPVFLNGASVSDPDGGNLSYKWEVESSPEEVTIANSDTATEATFTPVMTGTYVVRLTVSDGDNSPSDTVTITVVEEGGGTSATTADAGANQSVVTGSTVTLDGSGSTDPEGDTLTYIWSLSVPDGSSAALDDDASATPSFTADVAGTYTATLTVTDPDGNSDSDTVTVTASADGGGGVTDGNLAIDDARFFSDGNGSMATWDPDTGTVTVTTAGEPWQVNLSWGGISVTASTAKTVTFSCTGGNTVTVELKEDGDDYSVYASSEENCDGDKTVTLTPTQTDSAAQLSLGFGAATGAYAISNVSIE